MDLLKSIDVFREVCRRMSFSQAADRLNLVPSAVSRQVNELERYLGVRLLERTTRSISLTDDGRRYLQKMDAISLGVRELKGLSGEGARVEGHIRLTGPPILGPRFLHAALDAFLRRYPEFSLSATFVNREINLIEEGYDLAVLVGVYFIQGDISEGKLVPLLTNHLPEALPVSIVYPSRQLLGKAKRALIDHLIGHAKRYSLSDSN